MTNKKKEKKRKNLHGASSRISTYKFSRLFHSLTVLAQQKKLKKTTVPHLLSIK